MLGSVDPAVTDEHEVAAAGEAQGACAVAQVEHVDVDWTVSGAAAAPHIPPPLAVPLQECGVLTHPR
ncbi:hypothetical protein [Streptomyces canus]|uniref:hypothetical protein n=1 Tax=Streptomyces canus TaxID=58343 RepID=UPI002E3747BC|nr:hypothetical protein [Streptomyces canus]